MDLRNMVRKVYPRGRKAIINLSVENPFNGNALLGFNWRAIKLLNLSPVSHHTEPKTTGSWLE